MNNWSWLGFSSDILQLKKSTLLFEQGAQIQKMYFLVSGRAKLIRHSLDGEDVVLHVANAGELVAEASFFSEIYHCSAIIDQAAEIQTIDRDIALEKILSNAQYSHEVMRLFAQQVRDLRSLHELRNIRSAQKRILTFLAAQSDKNGRINLQMSLRDLAYKLGLAHETLYRELRNLQTLGKIKRISAREFVIII